MARDAARAKSWKQSLAVAVCAKATARVAATAAILVADMMKLEGEADGLIWWCASKLLHELSRGDLESYK